MVKNKKGFTLVELLAVIVILAIILVIAVPQIMKTIDEARKGALSSSAKLIAASAEREYLVRETLGDTDFDPEDVEMECSEVADTTTDYESCSITFNNGKATVQLEGAGKFAGKYVCNGTRESATVTESACSGGSGGTGGDDEPTVTPVSFTTDDWSTIVAAVSDGTYPSEYTVGSTKEINLDIDGNGTNETYHLRVANATACDTTWMNDTTKSQTACGFVLEFVEVLGTHAMHSGATSVGGYPASEMRTYLSETILPKIEAVIGTNTIKTTRVISGYESGKDANYSSDDKLYLLSTYEVWGSNPGYDSAATNTITRQLDYYEDNSVTTASPNREGAIKNNLSDSASIWWLRSATSYFGSNFYSVSDGGDWRNYAANHTYGVSPAFRIG